MHKVLISDSMSKVAQKIFEKNKISVDVKVGLSEEEIVKIIPEYDGMVVRSATKVTKKIILAAKKLKAIQRNWNSKHNTTGSTLVKFIILRNGILEDVVVERPSGFFALDMAAQRALLVTKQAPPLPDLFSNDTLTVHLWFEYHR